MVLWLVLVLVLLFFLVVSLVNYYNHLVELEPELGIVYTANGFSAVIEESTDNQLLGSVYFPDSDQWIGFQWSSTGRYKEEGDSPWDLQL